MTAGLIATIVGIVISVALEVIPGLKRVWAKWEWKRLVLLGGFVLVPVVAWLLACPAGLDIGIVAACTAQGLLEWALVGFLAFTGNQTAYLVKARGLPNAAERHPD